MPIKCYPYSSFKKNLEFAVKQYESDKKQKCVFIHDLKEWLDGVIARMKECPRCHGLGHPKRKKKEFPGQPMMTAWDKKCRACNGTGYVIGD